VILIAHTPGRFQREVRRRVGANSGQGISARPVRVPMLPFLRLGHTSPE
jgi:hypothetical protein